MQWCSPRSLLIDTNHFYGRRPIESAISASLRETLTTTWRGEKNVNRTQSHPDAEVGQQTAVKDVFLKSAIFPLLPRSREKSVLQEMWGIKRPGVTVATFRLKPVAAG